MRDARSVVPRSSTAFAHIVGSQGLPDRFRPTVSVTRAAVECDALGKNLRRFIYNPSLDSILNAT